ncbi:MAG: condensation domain-containing protein, partial [Rhizonema sp. PD38]|nr:condensation domain-containing protein [Rhizonema sp. PD38]
MNLVEFYQNLLAIGIELWVDGDKLCYEAPEDVLTSELLTEIKQYKEEIIHLLQKRTDTVRTDTLSHRQKALWFLYQLAPDSAAYNVAYPARLVSNVDIPALRQAAQALIERHPVLRTTYTAQQGVPVQTIQENPEVCFSVLEAVNWSQDDFHNWLISESDRPFDLSNGPVLRFNLLIKNILTDASVVKEVILLMTAHHIVVDFWSLELLVSELRVFYKAFKTGQEVAFPPQNQQYSYYVWWENQMLASQQGERLWNYWRDQLSGELPILNLPTDRPRPPVQTYKGASYSFILEEELTHKLLKLALAEGVTLYTLLLAAFQVLLLRYTNQADILIGSPMAGRSLTEFEKIVGYFTNSVVFRADLSGNPTFRELLCQVRSCVLGALEHQDYPFPLLVERLQPLRDPSRSPLYQVAFVWDRYHQNEGQVSLMDSDGLIVESITPESKGAPFDLDLTIFDVTGPLKGIWRYNTDLFDADTIERMAGHFQTLLTGIVANPIEPISALPLLTKIEQQQLLVEWNDTQAEYSRNKCIHQLFEEQVERTPDAVTVVYENQQLTYQQLNYRANQLAHYLRSLGVGPEVLVGICVERSLEMVVGLLGILKAGGAYVPLDPQYPTERKEFILADTQTPILLTQQHFATNLPTNGIKVICLDADWEVIATQQICNLFSETTALNLAYVIYTSGSTGKPKGTLIPHQGLVNYLIWCTQAYEVELGAGTLVHSPLGFDLTITSLFSPLLVGKRVEILPEAQDNDALSHSLSHHSHLSLVKITPAHLELLNQQLSPKEAASRTKALIIGGENLLAENIAFWQEFAPETILVNEYGPTETVVGCCIYQVPTGQHLSGSVPIGRAIANTQVYILDSNLQPVP